MIEQSHIQKTPEPTAAAWSLNSAQILIAILENGRMSLSELTEYLGWQDKQTRKHVDDLVFHNLLITKTDIRDARKTLIDFKGARGRIQAKWAKASLYEVKDETSEDLEKMIDGILNFVRGR